MSKPQMPYESTLPGLLLRLIRDQRVAFLVVGGINTVVAFGIFVICSQTVGRFVDHRFGTLIGTLVTIGIAFHLNVLFAFAMHRRFVFRVHGHVLRDLMRYWSVQLTGFGINAVTLPVLILHFGIHRVPAQAMLLSIAVLISYFGHKRFSFRRTVPDSQHGSSGM